MVYDSLLLNYGGGIIGEASKSEQFKGSAALAIGLGGTGVAALSVLKGKIYQQLHADNPEDPIPQYEGIQLLAIDSDEGDYKKYRGSCRLRKDEFLSICNPQLSAALKAKDIIKNDPLLNWMDIDHIDKMLSPQGAGGIRQVGRYLLMSKIGELEKQIESKCRAALKKRESQSLDIYVFAGISGGTGSGCFLDTCYIIRQIVENNGWNAKIMGYFFLPDVVTSKPAVANDPAAREYNEANGYAAMKELDYLMSLKDANDWFTQSYNSTLRVHTQEPPVDMCHLVSACKADGTMVRNGFTYGINVASDYVMAYLADVSLEGGGDGSDNGLTMRGHLANVGHGVDTLSREYGANLSYHIMGACNAEIPMSQINTYLACGFYAKFMRAINGGQITVTKSKVAELTKELKLTADDVSRAVVDKSPGLMLPPVDRKILSASRMPAKGYLNDEWARAGNDWLDRCDGQMVGNSNGLTMKMDSYEYSKANQQSLIGRVFRKLWELSVNPDVGPYFAAQILHNGSHDLTTELDNAIKTAEERLRTQEMYMQDTDRNMEMAKDTFYNRSANKNNYAAYEQAAGKWFLNVNAIKQQRKTAEVLRTFKKQVQELYANYFKPLCDMLDNLRETFVENQTFLSMPNATEDNAYTWQILTFKDIQKTLDDRIASLSAKELVTDFVSSLLENNESWMNGDQDKISMLIRKQMLELFKREADRSLQDYLLEKYPNARNDARLLAEEVEADIMDRVHKSAVPMFWCDPDFSLINTFASSSLSVPGSASAVCAAADSFKNNNASSKYTIRKTGIGDRIFALRLCSGVPLYAYQGITLLKNSYDKADNTPAGVGAHLYANTGRGSYGSGHKDWRHFLPTPMPYSRKADMIPEGEQLLKLYEEGEAKGVIGLNENKEYVIFLTKEYTPKTYSVESFMVDGHFSVPAYEKEYADLKSTIDNIHVKCEQFLMKNDGDSTKNVEGADVVGRCRRDYFLHYPLLQKAVRDELKKLEAMQASLAQLETIKAAFDEYEADMNRYCSLIFYRGLRCEDSMEQEAHDKIARIYCNYKDKYNDDRQYDFSLRGEAMPYGKDYPLYQGFLTYRKLDPKKSPRKELDELVTVNENRSKKLEDLCIPYDLEKIWTADAMDALAEEVRHKNADEAAEILRFYEGVRSRVRELKDDSPRWLNASERESLRNGGAATTTTTATAAAVDPNAYWHVWDPATGKTLVVYAQYGPTMAYDQTTQSWVNVHAGMKVYNGQAWVDLKTDPYFATI